MRINFVMSNNVSSGIFNAIIKYFQKYLPDGDELYVTEHPLNNMDIYHYHRPNLEKHLLENSVVTVHHDLEDTDPWFDVTEFMDKYNQADEIICLNSLQKNILEENEKLSNTTIIPHGVDKSLFSSEKKVVEKNKKLNIGIVSKRYGRRVKGEALLYELFKRLDINNIRFTFVGEGRTVEHTLAISYGFESVVYEALPYSLFNNLYSELDILLIPSLFEGGPANIPEALYTRTPIIGRKIAMISDVIDEGVNGYFLTGDPRLDASLINNLAKNENSIYTKLLSNINNYIPDILSWKEVVQLHVETYRKTINRNNDV